VHVVAHISTHHSLSQSRSSQRVVTPVNLKERIAALQQRTTSPNSSSNGSGQRSNSSISHSPSGKLRDRIAKFEEKGGIPVPRGSFGLGAPPTQDGPRKRGELYGNRLKSIAAGPPPTARRGLSLALGDGQPRKRCVSASQLDYSGRVDPTTPSTPAFSEDDGGDISPLPTSATFDVSRGSQTGMPRRQSIAGGICALDRSSLIQSAGDAKLSVKTGDDLTIPSRTGEDKPSLSPRSPLASKSQRSSVVFPTGATVDYTSPPTASLENLADTKPELDGSEDPAKSTDVVPINVVTDGNISTCKCHFREDCFWICIG
jgi:hypothetical protein